MWNKGTDPPYIPEQFRDDSLKSKKVAAKNPQKLTVKNNKNNNNKNTDETLQEQKDIPITWGCPN